MRLRKEEIYILYQKHIHRLTYQAVMKTDQNSALSLLGRLQISNSVLEQLAEFFIFLRWQENTRDTQSI